VTQERNLAQQERAKAEQVVTLFTDLFKAADPKEAGGDTLNVYQLMDQSRQRIETALAAQPDVQAKMWSVLGGVYFNMGQYDQAVHFQEQALALRRALYGNGHRDVAESMMLLGDPLRETAAYDRADSLLREALALQRTIHGDAHIDIVRTLNGLALTIESKGAFDEAEQLLREAVALRRRVQEEAPPDEATLLQNLGEVLREKGDYDNAQSVLLEALTLQKKSEANHTPRSP